MMRDAGGQRWRMRRAICGQHGLWTSHEKTTLCLSFFGAQQALLESCQRRAGAGMMEEDNEGIAQ